MKASISDLLRRGLARRGEEAEREIEEEFRFHLEMLTQTYLQQNMPGDEAKDAARRRFGNVDRIKDECMAITRRRSPFLVLMKSFLFVMFLGGLSLRFLKMDANVHHLGDLLIAVPTLSCLLLYVRSLDPSRFLSKPQASPLRLNENVQPLFTAYDQRMRTPVERLISEK